MLKYFFIICLLFGISINSLAQSLKITENGDLTIDSIVSFDSSSVEKIYNSVKKWSLSSFNNLKEVLVLDTPEEIQFRFIQNFSNGMSNEIPVYTTLNIKIKSNRAKFTYSNLTYVQGNTSFESLLILKDGTLRNNKPSNSLRQSAVSNFVRDVNGVQNAHKEMKSETW